MMEENAWTITGRNINRAMIQVGHDAGLSSELAPHLHLQESLEFPNVELMKTLKQHDPRLVEQGLALAEKVQKETHQAERKQARRLGFKSGWRAFLAGSRSIRF